MLEIVAFFVLAGAIAIFACWLRGLRYYNWGAFEGVFGFEPPSPEDGLDAIEKAQQKVAHKLHILAEDYAEADLAERAMAEAAKKAKSRLEAKAYIGELKLARERIKRAKTRFWRAYGHAEAFGFHVHEKYTDYLSRRDG